MSLIDCEKCWDTPCECGFEYRNSSIGWLTKMRDMFQRLIDEKTKNLETLTPEDRKIIIKSTEKEDDDRKLKPPTRVGPKHSGELQEYEGKSPYDLDAGGGLPKLLKKKR